MSSPAKARPLECIETNIPARLDRLPWSRWRLLVVVALGITWLLDGLESNLAGSLAGILKRKDTLKPQRRPAWSERDFTIAGS